MSSFSFSPTSPTYPRPLSVDVNGNITTEDVHAQLRALHSDELVSISPPTVLGTFYGWVKGYMKFLWMIWGHVITLGYTDTETFEWTLVFAIITTVLLVPMLIFCMLLSLPAVQAPAFKLYAYAVTTPMYESWWNGDKRALAASRAALCKPAEGRGSKFGSGYDNRHFDLDIARLLLQFSGLVYEHDSTAVRRALAIIKANTPLDIFGTLRGRGRVSLDKFIGEVPAQLARAALTGEEIVADVLGVDSRGRVEATLSPTLLPPPPPPSGASPAGSDNAIRGHLAGSGIEYEPVSELNGVGSAFAALFWHPHEPWIVVAFKGTSPTEFDEWVTDLTFTREDIGTHIPGFGKVHSGFKARVFPDEARAPRSLREHLKRHAEQLRDWWKPPSEAERKLRDLPVRTPYDTIRDSIQIVADNLTKNTGIHSINVYFTGHSLGCATASLAYARAVAKQNTDYKSNVRIRDAYLFAAPVIGDVKTRDAFNRIMGMGLPRSMWRVTNGPDAVAGMLPEMGDRVPLSVHPENPVAFAHLGLELKMAPAGPKGQGAQVEAVVAPHRPVWEPVTIVQATHYGREEEKGGRGGTTNDDDSGVFSETASERSTRARIVNRARLNLASVKELPFGIGYVLWLGVSHIISCYWDQILYVEPGECVWVEN